MIRSGHHAAAAPLAVGLLWATHDLGARLPWWVQLVMAGLVLYSSSWPDLDAASASVSKDLGLVSDMVSRTVRWVSWRVYVVTRTAADRERDAAKRPGDCHRGFTHSLEGVATFAAVVAAATWGMPVVGEYALWWAAAVFVGCASHVGADALTPSGVPLFLTVNALRELVVKRERRRGVWSRWCVWSRRTRAGVPLAWVGPTVPRRLGAQRGLFLTDSAQERESVIPALWCLAVVLALLATGVALPLVHVLAPVIP